MSGTCRDLRHLPWTVSENFVGQLCLNNREEGLVAVLGPIHGEDGYEPMRTLASRLAEAHNARLALYGPFGAPQDIGRECVDLTDEPWHMMGYGGVKDGASETGFLWCLHGVDGTVLVIEAWDAPGSREVREAAAPI